ncbi:MAG: glucan biosynthesis protein [Deltaproteobacteria bacterium]|jgi:glucans biosynthesis protein|nr:glucan biosynthesis protein [Deltaproteobacteria bacterium]
MDSKSAASGLFCVFFGSWLRLGAFICFCAGLLWSAAFTEICPAASENAVPPAYAPAPPENIPMPAQSPDEAPETAEFGFADVEEAARALAEKPYLDSRYQVPDFLLSITEAQWNNLGFNPEYTLWQNTGLPFEARFFHPGFIYNGMVSIEIVENGQSKKIPFSADMFNYDNPALAEQVRNAEVDFAGFSLSFPLHSDTYKDEIAVFLGATYFRALGRHTGYGLAARGLALNTGLAEEEFPYFRKFWLVKPEPDATSITVYALMDSPGMTGAFHYVITPGTSTVMDVSVNLFPRGDISRPLRLELAPISSMFLFSESGGATPEDHRPEVHSSDGLLYTSEDRWFWRPLSNPGRLAVNGFSLANPRGFGLIQRDDQFDHYQDTSSRFERRPSLWVEPSGAWGSGRLQLIEIPSSKEIHDNILVFWTADNPGAEGASAQPSRSFAYKLYWMAPNTAPHTQGRVADTRVQHLDDGITRFIIDFESVYLNALPEDTGLSSVIETPEGSPVLEKQLTKNPATGGWRLQFNVRLPKQEGVIHNLLATRENSTHARFSALLKKGENLPDALTETWTYDAPF